MKQRLTFILSFYYVFFFFQHIGQAANEKNEVEQEPIMQSELVQAQFERIGFRRT